MERLIIAHPEKQHSYRLAEAAYDAGILDKYITTTYYKKWNSTFLLDCCTKGKLNLQSIRKMQRIPDNKVRQYCELRGIGLLALRHTRHRNLINKIQKLNFDAFGRKVARYAKKVHAEAVVMYDTNSLNCFCELKGSGIIRIMDTSIANRAYTKYIYEHVIHQDSDWTRFSERNILLDKQEMDRLLEEIKETDYFLVPSTFVKKSLEFSGVKPEQIYMVPYGVDVDLFQYTPRRTNIEDGPLNVLFVGQCSYRKGINYLLEAVSQRADSVHATIVGGYQDIPDLYKQYSKCKNIDFLGRVAHDQLPEVYKEADIFVLPSLSEGMSLVGLEAMACGLPLLCSQNCGVNDVVEENVNGWVLSDISTKAIIEKIDSINTMRDQLSQIGNNARKTAEMYSWSNYNEKMQETLLEILGENP